MRRKRINNQKAQKLRLLKFNQLHHFVVIFSIITSCNSETKSQGEITVEYTKEEVPISDDFVNNYTLTSFAEFSDSFWLVGYNRLDHSLEYLDLKNYNHKKKVIEESGPNSIEYPISYMGANSRRSIVIKNPPARIYKIDHLDGLINQIALDSLPEIFHSNFRIQYEGVTFANFGITEYNNDNILTKILFPVSGKVDENFFENFGLIRLNTNEPEKSKVYEITFPQRLDQRNMLDLNLPEVSSFKTNTLISIPAISNIIRVDAFGNSSEVELDVPKNINKVISIPVDANNYRKRSDLLFKSPRFFPLQYFEHKDLFLRIYRHEINSRGGQKKSLLIYNRNFELIGQSDLPEDSGFKLYTGNENLYLTISPNNQDSENTFQFYQFKIHTY